MSAPGPWWVGQKANYTRWNPVVYRVYDTTGRLIYIGSTRDIVSRFAQHERLSWWHELVADVQTVAYPTQDAAAAAEQVAIQEEQPAFNVAHTTEGPVLTEADAQVARRWAEEPGHFLTVLALIDRLNTFRASVSSERAA
jgi:predicted GIY-YIG superfamily endonuclease